MSPKDGSANEACDRFGERVVEGGADVTTITDYEDRNGVPWSKAARPFRLHRHRWQTRAISDGERVERCACGAFGDGNGNWMYLAPDKPRVWP